MPNARDAYALTWHQYESDRPYETPQMTQEQDEIEELLEPGCPDCHCARIIKGESIHLFAISLLPNGDFLNEEFGYTERGQGEIEAHEQRRFNVKKFGYDEYYAQSQLAGGNVVRCGLVCSSTPGEAKAQLKSYLVQLRQNARQDFESYDSFQQSQIDFENVYSNTLRVPGIDSGGFFVYPLFDAYINKHTVPQPPPARLPDCPDSDCLPSSVSPI